MITIRVNGETKAFPAEMAVARLVRELVGAEPGPGIAVALNGEVVRRLDWANATIHDNDTIEIVRATQGG